MTRFEKIKEMLNSTDNPRELAQIILATSVSVVKDNNFSLIHSSKQWENKITEWLSQQIDVDDKYVR